MSPGDLKKLGLDANKKHKNVVKIKNPIGEDYSIMRTTLLPSLLLSVASNKNHNIADVKIFEMDRVFLPQDEDENNLPKEINILAAAVNAKGEDFYTLKGRLEELFLKFNIEDAEYEPAGGPFLHPGRSAVIKSGENELGYIGELHPDTAETYDISGRTVVCEIDIDMLIGISSDTMKVKPIPKYPAVQRDLAVVMDAQQQAGPLIGEIRTVGGAMLESCEIFDIYQGEQLEKGKKSVAFSLTFRAENRTLVDSEVNMIFGRLVSALDKKYGAKLRE
jgi:phenylalanyl-tRNA synthetase beta chain